MKSISPREEQPSSRAKRSFKTMYDERMTSLRTDGLDCPLEMTVRRWCIRIWASYISRDRRRARKRFSDSPTRPVSDGITMWASSTYNRLMMSMGTQKGGASSSTRLQPQLSSSSLGLTPVLGAANDLSEMCASVMTGLEELRHDMTRSNQGVTRKRRLDDERDRVIIEWSRQHRCSYDDKSREKFSCQSWPYDAEAW